MLSWYVNKRCMLIILVRNWKPLFLPKTGVTLFWMRQDRSTIERLWENWFPKKSCLKKLKFTALSSLPILQPHPSPLVAGLALRPGGTRHGGLLRNHWWDRSDIDLFSLGKLISEQRHWMSIWIHFTNRHALFANHRFLGNIDWRKRPPLWRVMSLTLMNISQIATRNLADK